MTHAFYLATLLALCLRGAPAAADQPKRPQHRPPPEALAACEDLAAGDACSVDLGDRAIEGTCRRGPDGTGPLACAPDGPPPGLPPEAFDAGDRAIEGTCRRGPHGDGPLACAPDR